ncbi:MAG: hypothetical protein JWM91_2833 [Rhodospirillales bacterium]|nr:hypothetical protein [Rhodospirillales bacterium]
MARKTIFPGLLATALIVIAAPASVYADPASENPAQAWIARIETPNILSAQPGTTTLRSDGARDFLARFENPSFSLTRSGTVVVDDHPDRDFIARLSTGHSATAGRAATPLQSQKPSQSVALGAVR